MNKIVIGLADKTEALYTKQGFLLIDDGPRNGFLYTMERNNGQTLLAKPYMDNINWTKGIDQKTGKPLDYDSTRISRPMRASPRPCSTIPPKRCVRVHPVEAISGPQPTAKRPSYSTSRPQRLRRSHAQA